MGGCQPQVRRWGPQNKTASLSRKIKAEEKGSKNMLHDIHEINTGNFPSQSRNMEGYQHLTSGEHLEELGRAWE